MDKSIDTDQHGQEYTEQSKEHAKAYATECEETQRKQSLNSTQDTVYGTGSGYTRVVTNLCECLSSRYKTNTGES